MLRKTTLICLCLSAFTTACGDKDTVEPSDDNQTPVDEDQDGYTAENDCNDQDVMINPAVPEICDGIDNDCDGAIDDEDDNTLVSTGTVFWRDADADGYGDKSEVVLACDAGEGYVDNDSDCQDYDATINPDGEETCDGVDNDCDGLIDDEDDSITGLVAYYSDIDFDGYGDANQMVEACDMPNYYVDNSDDCDDSIATISPDAMEYCDDVDNNCDGLIDNDPTDGYVVYEDNDSDGYGNANNLISVCSPITGYVNNGDDCDDTSATNNPAAYEDCTDSIDNNCDGVVNEDRTWHADSDGDGYGSMLDTIAQCDAPAGYTHISMDCNDLDPNVNPDASEIPGDELDSNCDGDEICFIDDDDDGWLPSLNALVVSANISCGDPGEGDNTDQVGDCDDSDDLTYPGIAFLESATDCMSDHDGDGWNGGVLTVTINGAPTQSITLPTGSLGVESVCTAHGDSLSFSYQSGSWASEVSYAINDPDGNEVFSDGQGFSTPTNGTVYTTTVDAGQYNACDPGVGGVPGTDCDDEDASINPAAGNCQ